MALAVGVIADAYTAPAGGGGLPLTGLQGWWDANDAASFTYSSGAVVSQWNDRTANGYHATQTNVSYQPTREITINGLYAVKFVGDVMRSTCPASAKPFTVAAAVRTGASVNNVSLVGKSANAESGTGNFNIDVTSSKYRLMKYSMSVVATATTAVTVNTNMVISLTYSGAGVWAWYLNGVADGTGTNNQTFVGPTTMSLGGALGDNGTVGTFSGHIGELVRYDAVLSAGDLTSLHSYLRTKWGTP